MLKKPRCVNSDPAEIFTEPPFATNDIAPIAREPTPPKTRNMKITGCPHTHRQHYAKGLCASCYKKFGKQRRATKCPHAEKMDYSMGMCQTCYLADYHQRRVNRLADEIVRQRQEQASSANNT